MESQSVRILAENRKDSAQTVAEISGGISTWKMWTGKQIMSVYVNAVVRRSFPMGIRTVNTAVTDVISMADLEVARMQVSKNMPAPDHVPARMMTKESMQKDFDYEMAQKITRNLLDEGLISIDEYDRISELNARKFSPFYGDLMDI
mgnify:CR=1 FL=1